MLLLLYGLPDCLHAVKHTIYILPSRVDSEKTQEKIGSYLTSCTS